MTHDVTLVLSQKLALRFSLLLPRLPMADHVSSIYSAIEDVPIIASPQYRVPKQVSLPYDFAIVPDDVSNIVSNLTLSFKIPLWSWPSKLLT